MQLNDTENLQKVYILTGPSVADPSWIIKWSDGETMRTDYSELKEFIQFLEAKALRIEIEQEFLTKIKNILKLTDREFWDLTKKLHAD